ncbi:MAG: hypothetical protein MI861_14480, partial [Pirellulales bacterium]|nr:hypothetical protein [Pirellulales bacterium]
MAIYTEYRDSLNTVTSSKTRYLHRDHLGSVESITDEAGAISEQLSYDPHGKRRLGDWQAGSPTTPAETPRGFTGHEHLDAVGLIHMNGRVYDPTSGRFLSADPFVTYPETTQGFNRYSYADNNPLSYTDPSGFGWREEETERNLGSRSSKTGSGRAPEKGRGDGFVSIEEIRAARKAAYPEAAKEYWSTPGLSWSEALANARARLDKRAASAGTVGTLDITDIAHAAALEAAYEIYAAEYYGVSLQAGAFDTAVQAAMRNHGVPSVAFSDVARFARGYYEKYRNEPGYISDEVQVDLGLGLRVDGDTLKGTITVECNGGACSDILANMRNINGTAGKYSIDINFRNPVKHESANVRIEFKALPLNLAGTYGSGVMTLDPDKDYLSAVTHE